MAAPDYIFNNFWWKMLSLLLAALTWLTIQTAFQRDQDLRETPVITVNLLSPRLTSRSFKLCSRAP